MCKQMTDVKWNFTVTSQYFKLFFCKKWAQVHLKMCLQIIYLIYMYKQDLALNNL